MSEIVLNGTKMWDGTKVQKEDTGWTITTPSAQPRFLSASDELVIDGEVVAGPRAGWKFEVRQVGLGAGVNKSVALLEQQIPGRQLPGSLLRDCWYRGRHSSRCEQTADGWVCSRGDRTGVDVCSVVDLPTTPVYTVTLDTLDEVVPQISRKRFRVHWTLSRHSHRFRFTNGRAVLPRDEIISREVRFKGQAWTKWGARRQIRKVEERERNRIR